MQFPDSHQDQFVTSIPEPRRGAKGPRAKDRRQTGISIIPTLLANSIS